MHSPRIALGLVFVSGLLAAAGRGATGAPPVPAFDEAALREHVKILASDRFEGRFPGSPGEELTVAYIADQFRQAGLRPGHPDGSYFQKVPLVGISATPSVPLTFTKGSVRRTLEFRDDVVAWTKRVQAQVSLQDSEVVFVGYGIEAPEYAWDDYKGLDATGKTLVILVNDPPIPDPANPGQLDPRMFGGRAMTYYGRWAYKYEIAARKKAAAVLIVHETEPAAYPFSVVQSTWLGEQFSLVTPDNSLSRAAIEGWITHAQAVEIFRMAGLDYQKTKAAAATREFRPIPLAMTSAMTIRNRIRSVDSRNVVGRIEGGAAALRDEHVIYMAHWDHFGVGRPVRGDQIYNGALDNATGVAAVIELARAFARLPTPPPRSLLFLATTAEEQGLLGADYYARQPLHPLERTLAVINIDALNIHGLTRDCIVTGLGQSDLDDYARRAAARQNRVLRPDPEPEKGGYFRADHFPFARRGVPAIYAGSGDDYVGKPPDYGRQVRASYLAQHYHQPSDEYRPEWDLAGALQDIQICFSIGYEVAHARKYPEWKLGSEFRGLREKMLAR